MFKQVKTIGMALLLGLTCNLAFASDGNGDIPTSPNTETVTQDTGKVSGTVTDDLGPVTGASVHVKGTGNGTVTDLDGKYSLSNLKKGDIIVVSFVGYNTQEIVYEGQSVLDIVLQEDTKLLDEVVVTALGIKRDKKALGYAIQEVKGDDIVASRETNVANALSGKISGLQVLKSSNGPAGSSKIIIRGNNSVTGLNQPLIVVDGVPIDNFTGAENNDYWNPTPDMGNGLADINSEDIESMTVLKGASAAALYGSRAGNGVILITTKTGRKVDGLGVTISSTISAETLFLRPDRQNSFGQGEKGIVNPEVGYSWGPEIKGQMYTRWDGKEVPMQAYDNVSSYFNKPGINFTNNVSFQQQFKNMSIYTSLNRMDDMSKIPGADLGRTTLTTRGVSKFGPDERFTLDTKVQYIKTTALNRPLSGRNASNPFLTMYTLPISMDITDFSAGEEEGEMIWWGTSSAINPYWAKDNLLNRDTRERFIIFGSLKYDFTDWLNAELRYGQDLYFTERENKTYGGSPLTATGRYFFSDEKFYEKNMSFLISAQKDNIFGEWGAAASFGGNMMHTRLAGINGGPDELLVRDLFVFSNAKNKINADKTFSEKRINSLYGTAQINYGGFFFLDGTFRNDWSSTLSPENRSFFYPSLSASWLISEMVNRNGAMPSWFNYAKIRASVAQVGNDLPPYELYNTYGIGKDPLGHMTASTNNTMYDPTVRSELITSYEIGSELRFFENKLALDIAWYKTNATRQLLNLPYDAMSGYAYKKVNAGNIQNQGVEIMLNARPIDHYDYGWHIQGNFAHNKNTIVELSPEVKDFYKLGGYDNLQVVAKIGGNYGEIFGTTFKRVDDPSSPYNGQIIVDKDGLPEGDNEIKKVGDQQSSFTFGLTNTFRYKGWSLSFLLDSRIGGHIFSGTNHALQQSGIAAVTAPNGKRDMFVVDGVTLDDTGNYVPNTKEVSQEDYWRRITGATGNLGITEANIYSATNIRLRNLQLNYNFNKDLLQDTFIRRLKLGVAINNVWMISSHMNGVDPESVFATGTNATGFEAYAPPTSRTYLFNVTIGF